MVIEVKRAADLGESHRRAIAGIFVDAFEQAVAAVPHVLQAQRLFGDPDLLRVITRDLPAFQQLDDDRLATLPGVQRLSSTLVMKSDVDNRRARPRTR
ncbi:Lrp/AsnC ligand binding domain-containing protein [Nonomuraea sp. NPDC049400]|uniref:Lrp/AsnC ligand binding domain-containing protein n=1 Tax=Nonomuraea sp. NPDC049400 TaxID=3364352 RepID=UPI00379CCB35